MLRHRLVLGGVVLSVGALVLAVVATAIDYWLVWHDPTGGDRQQYMGLWEFCIKDTVKDGQAVKTVKECKSLSEMEELLPKQDFSWLKGCEATIVLAILVLTASVFLPHVLAAPQRALMGRVNARRVTAAVIALGGILCFITAAVFGAKSKDQFETQFNSGQTNFHAGFTLSIVAGAMCLVSAVMLIAAMEEN